MPIGVGCVKSGLVCCSKHFESYVFFQNVRFLMCSAQSIETKSNIRGTTDLTRAFDILQRSLVITTPVYCPRDSPNH